MDGFVFAVIFYAMAQGRPLVVKGRMTADALANLNLFQEAWICWRPDRYRKIEIVPDEIVSSIPVGPQKAIAALSGGVDSVFTILRHATKQLGNASLPIESCLLVHGFDVPLHLDQDFQSLIERVRPLTDELGLQLRTIRTNVKALEIQDWEDSFLAQLAACLFNYSHEYALGAPSSGEPYNSLVLPWGQNPCTDYLLSGSTFRTIHDGAGFSRTEKVAAIARHQTASAVLKVCWEGENKAVNCGYCEKCIRTRLNFLAVGEKAPKCFSGELSLGSIRSVTPRNDLQREELRSILDYAKRRNVTSEWVQALETRLEQPITQFEIKRTAWMVTVRNAFHLIKTGNFRRFGRKLARRIGFRVGSE